MRSGPLALLALLCILCGQASAAVPRIYNGSALSSPPPWMGFLRVQLAGETGFCTAAAVAPNVVLTAAHCVVDDQRNTWVSPSQVTVAFGDNDPWGSLAAGSLRAMPVVDYLVPSAFRMGQTTGAVHDVALLRLQAPAPGVVAQLPASRAGLLSVGRAAVVLGWGETVNGPPRALQRADLQLQPYTSCARTFGSYDSATMLCAWNSQGQSACHGDSGAPLLVADATGRYYQVGVVSGGDATCDTAYPTIFSNVAGGALAGFVARYSPQLQHAADRAAPASSRVLVPLTAPGLAYATAVDTARRYATRAWALRVYKVSCSRSSGVRFRCRIEGSKLGRRGWIGRMTITRTRRGVIVSR